jgi:hypothetical protein
VSEGDTVMALGKGGDSIRVFAGMVGTPWVLEIGPLYQMNPYPPQWLILIALIGLTLIGLIVYLLVRQLERRLAAWKPPPRASPRAAWKPACRPVAPTRWGAWRRRSMAWPSTCSSCWRSSANWCAQCPMSCARRWRACASAWR